jgi:hypothetical protein
VDEIDPQGKVSLSLAGDPLAESTGSSEDAGEAGNGRRRSAPASSSPAETPTGGAGRRASFEDKFADELESTFGNLGPADLASGAPASGPRRSPEGGGGRRGPGGGSGTARRRPRSGGR